MKLLLLAIIAATALTGCTGFREGYKKQSWTPDGFNYTLSRDRRSGDQTDYFGLNWSLK